MKLVTVRVRTLLGDEYVFPAVTDSVLGELRKATGTSLVLVNTGGACLTLPLRIVSKIFTDQEELWTRPTSNSS